MAHSFVQVYIHLTWHTKHSRSILTGRLETFVHRRTRELMDDMNLVTLAVNSAWDHMHMFAGWHQSVALDDFVRTVKSKLSNEWNHDERRAGDPRLKWQVGYGALSTRRGDIDRVTGYIDTQKARHRQQHTWEVYEAIEYNEVAHLLEDDQEEAEED